MDLINLLFELDELTGMRKLYALSVWLGILLPLVSVLFSGLTDSIELDFDFPMNPFLPLKPSCIMLFLLVFGTSGLLFMDYLSCITTALLSFFLGYAAAGALYALIILPMKKSSEKSRADKISDYIGKEASVSVRIKPHNMGAVNISSKAGSVSFVAMSEDGDDTVYEEGETVEICAVSADSTILTVRRKKYF